MILITFRCLLRLIFRGRETIDTPKGLMIIQFSWRDKMRKQKQESPRLEGWAGDGCYIQVKPEEK